MSENITQSEQKSGPSVELRPLLIVRVGDKHRPAGQADLDNMVESVMNAVKGGSGVLVTHHAVQFELVHVPVFGGVPSVVGLEPSPESECICDDDGACPNCPAENDEEAVEFGMDDAGVFRVAGEIDEALEDSKTDGKGWTPLDELIAGALKQWRDHVTKGRKNGQQ
jgi:hypothetical protein